MTDPRLRGWDVRIVFVERRQCWWWNAWRPSTCTELHGFADSPDEAAQEMYRAIEEAGPPTALGARPTQYRSQEMPRNDHLGEIES
jgi:hypothetical protein